MPKTLYSQMIERLADFTTSKKYKTQHLAVWGAKRSLHAFLTRRCSREFLVLYLQKNPEILDRVCHPGLRLSWSSEVDLALRLHKLGLLPEENRRTFVEVVSEYAVNGEDVYALHNEAMRDVFTDVEFEALFAKVRAELFPRLGEVRQEEQDCYRDDEPADEHMAHLVESFERLKDKFSDDAEAVQIIEGEIGKAKNGSAKTNVKFQNQRPVRLTQRRRSISHMAPGASLTTLTSSGIAVIHRRAGQRCLVTCSIAR